MSIQPFQEQVRFSNFIMNLIARDVEDADARRRTRDGEGASLSWVVGHLIVFRTHMMNLFGANEANALSEVFGDSATDGSSYPPLPSLLTEWNATAERLDGVLATVTDDALGSKPGGMSPHGEKTRIETMAFFVWHEAYHIGQMGTLRRELGYPATADLALAASKKG